MKEKARKRNHLLQKQKVTGGGKLSNQEKRIVESQAYSDLVAKLGISASGNDARNDSDSQAVASQAPTGRLQTAMIDLLNENTLDSLPGLLFRTIWPLLFSLN